MTKSYLCPECGAVMSGTTCPNCGEWGEQDYDGAEFCADCGNELSMSSGAMVCDHCKPQTRQFTPEQMQRLVQWLDTSQALAGKTNSELAQLLLNIWADTTFDSPVSALLHEVMHRLAPEFDVEDAEASQRPVIVCLCGSTRFWRTFQQASLQETLAGNIVLSIGAAAGTDDQHFGNMPRAEYDRVKTMLDQLHFRKIEMADEILILNVDGYMGESTRRELQYARELGKPIRFWESIERPEFPFGEFDNGLHWKGEG